MHRIALPALLLFCAPAQAGLYSWTDADGRRHFGDQPPSGAGADIREIEERKAYSPGTDNQAKEIYQRTNRMFDARDRLRQEERAQQEKQAAERAETLRAGCFEARDRARRLSGPVIFVDDSGREVPGTDAERRQRLQETRDWIAAHCN